MGDIVTKNKSQKNEEKAELMSMYGESRIRKKYGCASILKGPLRNNNKEDAFTDFCISEPEKAHQPLTKEKMEELNNE